MKWRFTSWMRRSRTYGYSTGSKQRPPRKRRILPSRGRADDRSGKNTHINKIVDQRRILSRFNQKLKRVLDRLTEEIKGQNIGQLDVSSQEDAIEQTDRAAKEIG